MAAPPDVDPFGNETIGPPARPAPGRDPDQGDVDPFGNPTIGGIPDAAGVARKNLFLAQDTSPEEMSKSYEIGHQLGMPPPLVQMDPDKFKADAERQKNLALVDQNPNLADWLARHPDNAKVAHDDLGAIHNLYLALEPYSVQNILGKLNFLNRIGRDEGDKQFREAIEKSWQDPVFGFNSRKPLEQFVTGTPNPIMLTLLNLRIARTAMYGAFGLVHGTAADIFGRNDLAGIAGGEFVHVGGDIQPAVMPIKRGIQYSILRATTAKPPVLQGQIDPGLAGPRQGLPTPEPPSIDLGRGEYQAEPRPGFPSPATAEPHVPPVNHPTEVGVRENETPQPGTDWVADQIHLDQHAADMAAFEDAFQKAQEVKMHEHNPDALEDAIRQVVADKTLYIPSETIERFYRDVEPHPQDNVLGWVDNAPQKVATSLALGTDLQVPVARALARMDPSVWTAIKDSVRFNQVGLSAESAKALKEKDPETYVPDTKIEISPELADREDVDPSQLGHIAARELFQNALDGIENKSQGKIDVIVDGKHRILTVHDNGRGMSPDTLTGPFLDAAKKLRKGSAAKALTHYHNKGMKVYTLHNGMMSTVDTDGKSLEAAFRGTGPDISMESHTASIEDQKMFPDGHGTRIELTIPTHYEDRKTGLIRPIGLDEAQIQRALVEAGAKGNVTFNGKALEEAPEPVPAMTEQELTQPRVMAAERTDLSDAVIREARALYLSPVFPDQKSAGMDKTTFTKYSDRIEDQVEAANEKALEKAKALVKKRVTEEWKANREEIKQEVATDLRSSPPVAADRYIRLGELPTGEIQPRQKLDEEAVKRITDQDLSRYTVKRGGIDPDDIAPMLQFENGRQLVAALAGFEKGRLAWNALEGNKTPKGANAYLNHLIDLETNERMERRYGSLQGNILDEARDIIMEVSHLDILTDELKQLAKMAGLPFDKATIPAHMEDVFATELAKEAKFEKYRSAAIKNLEDAQKALLKGNAKAAFQAALRRFENILLAKEAKAFDKKRATAERNFKKMIRNRNKKRPQGDDPYLDNAIKALRDIGFEEFNSQQPSRDIPALEVESQGQVVVAPWIWDLGARDRPGMKYDNLTTAEWTALNNSIKSLQNAGAQARVLDSAFGAATVEDVARGVAAQNERFGLRPAKDEIFLADLLSFLNYVKSEFIMVERVFYHSDRADPNGLISRFVVRRLRDAYTRSLQLVEDAVIRLQKLEPYARSGTEALDNQLIMDPKQNNKRPYFMTRHNLRMVMLHFGSKSGREKMIKDYNIPREKDLFDLIHSNAIKEDVDFVNGMHELFDWLWGEAAPMIRRYTGVEPDRVTAMPYSIIKSDGKGGFTTWELPGGYAPYFHDKDRSNIQGDLAMKGDMFDPAYIPAIPAHGYSIKRTDYKGFMDMNGTLMKLKIHQMINDIAFREAARDVQKLLNHPIFRQSFTNYWGPEYTDKFNGYLRSALNVHSFDDQYTQGLATLIRLFRQATVSTLINYNPGTALKHVASAGLMSAAQRPTMVGGFIGLAQSAAYLNVPALLQAMKMLAFRPKNKLTTAQREAVVRLLKPGSLEFIMQSSAMMRNRIQQYPDTLRGAYERATERGITQRFRNLSSRNNQYGRFMVALSDFFSAALEWDMTYRDAIVRTGDHDSAVSEADLAVSRAHGSSFAGDKAPLLNVPNTWYGEVAKTSMALYAFFNHLLNNWVQWAWDLHARTTRGAGSEPGANTNHLLQILFILGIGAAMAEEFANPPDPDDKEGYPMRLFFSFIRTYGGMFPFLREITNGALSPATSRGGWEPSAGMFGAASKMIYSLVTGTAKATGIERGHTTAAEVMPALFAVIGMLGAGGQQIGRTAEGAIKLAQGRVRPKATWNLDEYRALIRRGYLHNRGGHRL